MSCRVIDNNAYELAITPSRKRKRESVGKLEEPAANNNEPTDAPVVACFTNAAFSSTPKKLLGKRLLLKENLNPFLPNPCLEVKSILDIVQKQQQRQQEQKEQNVKTVTHNNESVPENPFEVVRKPPKKKKKRTEVEEACFENPALNLELPEKQFNPFEVLREPERTAKPVAAKRCFINAALNLRGQDAPASRNPFEIQRCSAVSIGAANPAGVENFALEMAAAQPSNLQIGLPFTPTLGCRIDFKNMPLSELTPSKMLAEKLVFSPVPPPKRSLSSINEETMDIGKELDRYQLELENSINEAKLRKIGGDCESFTTESIVLEVERKQTFTQKLTEIIEKDEEIEVDTVTQKQENPTTMEVKITKEENPDEEEELQPLLSASTAIAEDLPPTAIETISADVVYVAEEDGDDEFQLDDEDELDFKAPAPFVRAYRRAEPMALLAVSKESINSNKSDSKEPKKATSNVKNIIRNSIRKLMHPNATQKPNEKVNAAEPAKPTSIMSSIRHSLRRKPQKQPQQHVDTHEETVFHAIIAAEISIIDSNERIKLKSNFLQTEYTKMDELNNYDKKHSLRSSIRKSTREARQQLMKTVFNKHQEEYAFQK